MLLIYRCDSQNKDYGTEITTMLQVKFYGTRGSISVSGKEYTEFGGNTTCIQIKAMDTNRIAILDAGTGIRQLGKDFKAMNSGQTDLFIAFSHFHWDHIQGFPFFAPAYDRNMQINFLALGVDKHIDDLRARIEHCSFADCDFDQVVHGATALLAEPIRQYAQECFDLRFPPQASMDWGCLVVTNMV